MEIYDYYIYIHKVANTHVYTFIERGGVFQVTENKL